MTGSIGTTGPGRIGFALMLMCMLLSLQASPASAGYAHYVFDANSGKVLAAENADVLNHPASLTKMMTLYMVFEALHDGRLRWDQKIVMSKNGAATIPTKLGVRAGKTFTVREAVYGMAIKSANDAAEAMGDHLAGSEQRFAQAMTRKARQLGMRNTTFRNASGLPDRRQVTTARDMAVLAVALINNYPKEYAVFSQRSFSFRGHRIRGHNNLMYRYKGMDGIKTGYTDASGFNLVSAVNDRGRRVIGVVLGGRTARSRDDQMAALLNRTMPRASGRGLELAAKSAKSARAETADILPQSDIPLPTFATRTDAVAQQIAAADGLMADTIEATVASEVMERSRWEVQIAATDTQAGADALLSEAARASLGRVSGISPYIERVTRGSATLYRARFTGFDSRSAAQSACRQLQVHAYSCMVMPRNG